VSKAGGLVSYKTDRDVRLPHKADMATAQCNERHNSRSKMCYSFRTVVPGNGRRYAATGIYRTCRLHRRSVAVGGARAAIVDDSLAVGRRRGARET